VLYAEGIDTAIHDLRPTGQALSHQNAIGLVLDPGQPVLKTEMISLFERGVKLVLWKPDASQADTKKRPLWASSRAGIWNHLILPREKKAIDTELLRFALNNPNIVHSYSFDERSFALQTAAMDPLVGSLPGYHSVQPLPGIPIWKTLDTPEQLLCLLNTFGLKQVQKWLVMEGTDEVYCLGSALQYHYSRPADLPYGFFEEICRMVESGGSVNMHKVQFNLERAFLIGYAVEFGLIVGNSSLKEPRPEYIQSLNQNTGLDFNGFLERGYTSVRPEYRGMGIGTRLLGGLTKQTKGRKLYSIISEDNLATQKIAIRNKTRKLTTFFSQKTGKQVGVWVPE
jgi:GNAT superfamily N-acetyltransferase